jgi:Domain of unknown function (DUF4132)/HEAT repeats
MFKWLKNKATGVSNEAAAERLRAEFKHLENVPNVPDRVAERLADYVLTGDSPNALAELARLQNVHLSFSYSVLLSHEETEKRGLPELVNCLPQDPEILLRLAKVYEAIRQAGAGSAAFVFGAPVIHSLPKSLTWLSTFLLELSSSGQQKEPIFPAGLVVAMIEASGENPNVLIRAPFFCEDAQGKNLLTRWTMEPFTCFHCLDQFPELALSSPDEIRPAFRQKQAGSRAAVLHALSALKISPEPFVEEIAALAVSGSKEVRENAAPLISEQFSLFRELLKRHAEKGSADERYQAVRWLTRLGGDAEREFLARRLTSEKSEKICEILREAIEPAINPKARAAVDDYQLPEVAEVPVHAPLDKKILENIRDHVQSVERNVALLFAANQFVQQQGWTRTPVPPEAADRLFEALQTYVIKDRDLSELFEDSNSANVTLLQQFPIPPEFQLIHVIRWCLLLSTTPASPEGKLDQWQLGFHWSQPLLSYQRHQKKPIDLRELAAVFKTLGLDDGAIGRSVLLRNEYMTSIFPDAEPARGWPYFAERLHLFAEALGLKRNENQYGEQAQRQNAFRILKLFPHVPSTFVQPMWEFALGGSKADRLAAQECLANFPNKEQKILAALESRQQDARIAAAQWLANLDYRDAIPALRKALAKEKSEVVRDELIKALEWMGVPLDELLDIDKLDQEAEKGLSKGMPKDLDWFPFPQLPAVVWADSKKPVPTAIVHWFILQGYKLKTAEASPAFRRYCSLFRQEDREQLGKFILEAWIAEDTKPKYTADQAAAEAQRVAQQTAAFAKQYPQYYPDFDEQRIYQTQFNMLVIQPEGSQTNTKGILAVAGACCGSDAAPIVHRYVKQWYGHRAAQCKALLQVLAWIDHPSATQVILAVANRFRTKGIQEEAQRLCQMLAERKGWTMDELSDRTIPTAGLDEVGTMELDYGTRKFTARLSEEMAIVLTNQNGKVIASLPDGNQADEHEKVKQSKAALSNARKELKSVFTMQRDRLYEALCTQRTWRFEDWDLYLRQHPIVGRYCQRLVWVAYDGENVGASFRPLPDGTLTNHQDDEVTLPADASIRPGHDETLAAEDRTAWLQHFSDYEVEPLFQQFGKQQFTLAGDMKESTEIKEFLGHIVKAFSLRNRLTRLGYTRGATEDGGWFYQYRKTFMSLGLEAIIEFTGNSLPEENRTVALQRLSFTRKIDHSASAFSRELPLGELPRVLLAECWNDIRMAAADGPGFAADWEKQTGI